MKNIEENFSKLVTDKYGKINLDPKTGEITNLD